MSASLPNSGVYELLFCLLSGQDDKAAKAGKQAAGRKKKSSEHSEEAAGIPPKEKKIRPLVKKGRRKSLQQQDVSKDARLQNVSSGMMIIAFSKTV